MVTVRMYDQVSVAYGKMEIEAQRSATAAHLHLCIDGLEFEVRFFSSLNFFIWLKYLGVNDRLSRL